MRKSRFTEEQTAMALRQGEAGSPVEEICRKLGVSEGTYLSLEEAVRRGRGHRAVRAPAASGRKQRAEGSGGRPHARQEDASGGARERMVKPTQRRSVAEWAKAAYQVSEHRACEAFAVPRSSFRYRSVKSDQESLRRRLRGLTAARVHAGRVESTVTHGGEEGVPSNGV